MNKAAAEAVAGIDGVHACTDITGFGLAGHGTEMAAASGVSLTIDVDRIPVLEGAFDLVGQNKSGGMNTNRAHFGPTATFGPGVTEDLQSLVFDPQTSGGLLLAVDPAQAARAMLALKHAGVPATDIGEVTAQGASRVIFL